MANMNYHKVYMNQIHSSSLLCELAQMWKNQSLCDAVIKTGTVTTKAHRLVLVAACPMLKSMENASVGSHLEVRLASDIKQDSINTFLQYLYEGVMLLTEDNFRDIEKIARILQVDSVIKCCADFYKCLHSKSQYKYDYNDHIEFKHVRQTDMLKNSDRLSKRNSDSIQPSSPGGKRPRIHILSGLPGDMSIHGVGHKMDDRLSMAHSYMSSEPPIRPHKMGPASVSRRSNVVDVVEDSVEIVQTEKDPGGSKAQSVDANSALSISVASQIQSDTNIQVINVSNSGNSTTTTTTSSASSSDPKSSSSQDISSSKVPTRPQLAGPFTSDKPPDSVPLTSTPLQGSKSFAAGSAKQAAAATAFYSASTPSSSSPTGQGGGGQEISKELSSTSTPEIQKLNSVDTSPDLSLVKKEPVGLDMQVDMQHEHGEEATSDVEFEEPPQEGSMTLDQAALSWYQGQAFKGFGEISFSNSSTTMLTNLLGEPIESRQENGSGPYPISQFANSTALNTRNTQHFNSKAAGENSNEHNSGNGNTRPTGGNVGVMFDNVTGVPQDKYKSTKYTTVSEDNIFVLDPKVPASTHHNASRSLVSSPYSASDISNIPQMSSSSGSGMLGAMTPRHRLVANPGKKARHCTYCKLTGSKTECGWGVKCYYRCEACDVPLCNMKRDCFNLYHEQLKQTTQPDIQWERNQMMDKSIEFLMPRLHPNM